MSSAVRIYIRPEIWTADRTAEPFEDPATHAAQVGHVVGCSEERIGVGSGEQGIGELEHRVYRHNRLGSRP